MQDGKKGRKEKRREGGGISKSFSSLNGRHSYPSSPPSLPLKG